MNQSDSKRFLYLGGVALLLLAILIIRWIHGWGLVTIHVKDAPISKVIASISRQGHVRVESSLDPMQLVSMDVDKVLPAEAVDTLAIRANASWRLVYLVAPTNKILESSLRTFRGAGRIQDWATLFDPSSPLYNPMNGTLDPGTLDWTPEGPDLNLSKLLDEAAQKSGVMITLPKDWTPIVRKLPKTGPVGKVIPSLVGSVRGKVASFFFLEERRGRANMDSETPSPSTEGWDQQAGSRATVKSEWMEQRMLAQIKHLPTEEQAEARKEFEEITAMTDGLKALSAEQRRAKMRELLAAHHELVMKIMERQMLRNAQMAAQQRIQRAVNYLNRKASSQASQTH